MMATRAHGLDERGMAAVMALIVVLALSLLVAAFLAVSAFEPQISQNLAEAMQAQYAADAGIEWAFDKLVDTNSWNTLLTGAADCATPVTPAGWSNVSVPNLAGVFTVSLRNDCLAGDDQITGVADVTGTAINDGNGVVILTATGSFHGAQKKIQVVMRRHLPPGLSFPAAVNEPGLQSDTNVVCAEKEGPCANLGIATQLGNQANLGEPPTTYVQNVENAFTSGSQNQAAQKQTSVTGKDQTSGLAAMGATNTLTPDSLQSLLSTLSSNPKTQILQSTLACPMQITGDVGGATSTPTVSNGCDKNRSIDLGTPSNPQLVYFRGDLDPTSNFTGLAINNQVQGAGILVVEDGDLKVFGNLTWHGVIIVTGRNVGAGFMDGSTTMINGALVSNETVWNEQPGFAELHLGTMLGSATFHYSQQALDLMNRIRKNHTLYGWRTVSN